MSDDAVKQLLSDYVGYVPRMEAPIVVTVINETVMKTFIDIGAQCSMISEDSTKTLHSEKLPITVQYANDSRDEVNRVVLAKITMGSHNTVCPLYITRSTAYEVLLGHDTLLRLSVLDKMSRVIDQCYDDIS